MANSSSKPSRTTAISTSFPDRIVVRGYDLSSDLIGQVSFSEFFLLLLTGQRASPELVKLLDATLVAISEHGLTPSVQAARMTYSSDPNALQGAVAAGLLGCGSVVLGASEAAAKFMAPIAVELEAGAPLEETVVAHLRRLRSEKAALPGFGHREHKDGDPRAKRLLEMARELGTAGRYVEIVEGIIRLHPDVFGRTLPINVTGAIPAVLLDAGFPAEMVKGVPLVARAVGIIAHLLEESRDPIGFFLADTAGAVVRYSGPDEADRGDVQ